MFQAIFKLSKWLIAMSFLICGIFAMSWAATDSDIRPVGLMVVSFAFVFWLSKSTYEASKRIFAWGMAVLFTAALLTYFITQFFFGAYLDIGFYRSWELTMLILGLPVMSFVFLKDDA